MGKYELEVTTFQMAVLFAWNQRQEDLISFESLRQATPILHTHLHTQTHHFTFSFPVILVMCSVSTNGERVGLANSKLTIDSLLETLVESPTESYRRLSLL